jgi:hypothetical protein
MSAAANHKFSRPNIIGVKEKLKTKFKINGTKTFFGISFFTKTFQKTQPKETNIIKYKTGQTTPKAHSGGAKKGLTHCSYCKYSFI